MKFIKIKKRRKRKEKIFDRTTIFLSLLLTGLILVIGGMLIWKEKNVKTNFSFFSSLKVEKSFDQINKNDKILISFSGPVQESSISENISIEPQLDFSLEWTNNHQVQINIEEDPLPGENYFLNIEKFKSKWGILNGRKSQEFSTDPLPQLKSFYPTENQTEVDIDEKIIFEFLESLPKQYYLKIKTNPEFKFTSTNSENKNQIIIQPLKNLAFDSNYQLNLEVKSQNYPDFSYTIFETQFKTKKPPVVVYGWNSEGNPTKTEERLFYLEPKILSGKYIDIDLTNQNLSIFENGQELGAYKVSTGIRGMNTPTGNFKVIARSRRPWSGKYGLFMPWFIQFTNQGHGIHELPEWPGGYKEGANHLGIPVSHGCVRLGVGPAKKVYEFADPGTPIIIHY